MNPPAKGNPFTLSCGRAVTRHRPWTGLLAVLILLNSGTSSAPQEAQTAQETMKLKALEQEMEEARQVRANRQAQRETLQKETSALQDSLIETAVRIRAQEDALWQAESRLGALMSKEQKVAQDLSGSRAELAHLLGAMQMLERQRPPALLVSPNDAVAAVRSAILLDDILPKFVDESREIEQQLSELQRVRRNIIAEQTGIMAGETALEEQRARIEALIAQKKEKRQRLTADLVNEEQRIAQLGRQMSSLKTLIARLTAPDSRIAPREKPAISVALNPATRGAAEISLSESTDSRPAQRHKFTEARGTLPLPVSGNILTTYGARNTENEISMGLTIAARENAQVIAPFDGNIVYAGPFLDYDQLLLIETGEGYHILFTGMARIYGQVGDRLLAGEPVGIMGQVDSAAPDGERQSLQLYIEFRKDGEPINPMPWIATNQRKVSG